MSLCLIETCGAWGPQHQTCGGAWGPQHQMVGSDNETHLNHVAYTMYFDQKGIDV